MTQSFDDLWRFVIARSACFPVVQEYNELKHVFDLMKGCESYLEVGTAEGNSLYILAHALKPGAHITYIDWDETHTRPYREEVVRLLRDEGYHVRAIHANSNTPDTAKHLSPSMYDCVMIDAGHEAFNVMADAMLYAWRAKKYCFFHDVKLPQVNKAFEWYAVYSGLKAEKFSNTESFGYGILRR